MVLSYTGAPMIRSTPPGKAPPAQTAPAQLSDDVTAPSTAFTSWSCLHVFSFTFRPPHRRRPARLQPQPRTGRPGAGATVGVVALPLAMAFAIASGLRHKAGLWTAIIGGFLVALLGGTNVQIGGPAGAFIVIVYGIVERYGVANLLISTACAGVLLFALGLLRLGNLVRFVPVSIVIGFTNGIAVLIAVSQLKDFLGLSIEKMPGNFFSQVHVLALHIDSANPMRSAWARPAWAACSCGHACSCTTRRCCACRGPYGTVFCAHSRAGDRAHHPHRPVARHGLPGRDAGHPLWRYSAKPASVCPARVFLGHGARLLVAPTITIALLGAIESLLCARVADQLASSPHIRKHDPNQELMAQGVANFVVPFSVACRSPAPSPARSPICAPEQLHPSRHGACGHTGRHRAGGGPAGTPIFRWLCSRASCCTWPGTWGMA